MALAGPGDDKASLYSYAESISTEAEVPTTPPPEYDIDATPRGSFDLRRDAETDLTAVPGLEGLPHSITNPRSLQSIAGPSNASASAAQFSGYRVATSTLSKDRSTVTTSNPVLLSSTSELTAFLRAQTALPPIPEIRIIGEQGHTSGDTGPYGKKIDFDIRLNLLRYLVPTPHTPSGRPVWTYVQVKPGQSPSNVQPAETLEQLATAFVADSASSKSLTLTRSVINWDTDYLRGSVLSLLSDLKYRGHVTVRFSCAHSQVVVQPQRTVADTFKSLFYDKRTYGGLEAVWKYADAPPPGGTGDVAQTSARRFAVRSEQAFWRDWKCAVEKAALEGRKGVVGIDDLLETRLGFPAQVSKFADWGSHSW